MAYQSDPDKTVIFEKETTVRDIGGKDAFFSNGHGHGERTDRTGFSARSESNGPRSYLLSDEPSMTDYIKGFSKVAKKAYKEYKDVLFDVCQSLLVLFMQHPSVGILFLVTALFVLVPVGIFLGFAVISFVSIVVTALFIEGIVLGTGLLILFFVVPAAFVIGLGVAVFATVTWIAVTAVYKFVRGERTEKMTTKLD